MTGQYVNLAAVCHIHNLALGDSQQCTNWEFMKRVWSEPCEVGTVLWKPIMLLILLSPRFQGFPKHSLVCWLLTEVSSLFGELP